MDEKSTSGEPSGHSPPQGQHTRLRDAFELLGARRYKHVERLLQEQQEAAQRSGQMAMVVILAAACQLCLTCRQFQADRELHQLGLEEAARRERESRLQIQAVLTMLSQLTSFETQVEAETASDLLSTHSEPIEPEEIGSDKQPTLIQKVKKLLGFEPTSLPEKSEVGSDREIEEHKASPYDQIDSAIALRYLAHELEMLEKTGESLSPEQKILQAVAASLTTSHQQGDDTLESIAYKTHKVEPQQASAQPLEERDGLEEKDRLPDQKNLPEIINEDEDPMPDDEQSGIQISEQTRPVESPKMSHVQPEHVSADEDMSSPSLVVHCLGPFQVYSNNKPIERWSSIKGKSIFKYLVNNRERPVAKEVLMDLFWPEAEPDVARKNLNVAIYRLRQVFMDPDKEVSHVLYQDEHYLLNPDLQVWLDVEEFITHLQNGQKLQRGGLVAEAVREFHAAEALYQGEFLEEDRYEEWLMPLRQQLTSSYLELLERLSQYYSEKDESFAAVAAKPAPSPVESHLLPPPPIETFSPAVDPPPSSPRVPEVKPLEDTSQEVVPVPTLGLESPPVAHPKETGPISASLVVYCLGSFRVFQNHELITEWSGLMGQKILKYIMAQRGKPVPKDALIEVMWANVGQEAARRNLHQAIYSLRQTLRMRDPNLQHILFENDHYLLNPATDFWIDFLEFERNAQDGQRLEAAGETEKAFEVYGVAEGLFQGGFLEEDLYEEWTNPQRDYLHNLYLEISDRLSKQFLNQRNYVATIALCQKALGHDSCFEPAHLRLMQCYLAQGQRYLAMRQYQTCVQVMKEELNLNPSEETEALFQRIIA